MFWTALNILGIVWVIASILAIFGWWIPGAIGVILFLTSEFYLRRLAKKIKKALTKTKGDK